MCDSSYIKGHLLGNGTFYKTPNQNCYFHAISTIIELSHEELQLIDHGDYYGLPSFALPLIAYKRNLIVYDLRRNSYGVT